MTYWGRRRKLVVVVAGEGFRTVAREIGSIEVERVAGRLRHVAEGSPFLEADAHQVGARSV